MNNFKEQHCCDPDVCCKSGVLSHPNPWVINSFLLNDGVAPSSCAEPQRASGVQHIITSQITAAQLPQAGEWLSAMQNAPVINEQDLRENNSSCVYMHRFASIWINPIWFWKLFTSSLNYAIQFTYSFTSALTYILNKIPKLLRESYHFCHDNVANKYCMSVRIFFKANINPSPRTSSALDVHIHSHQSTAHVRKVFFSQIQSFTLLKCPL